MTDEETAIKIATIEQQVASNEMRISKLENFQEEMRELSSSVAKIAQSIKYMATEQERQSKQLSMIESSKADTMKYWLRTIFASTVTGLIAYALGALIK